MHQNIIMPKLPSNFELDMVSKAISVRGSCRIYKLLNKRYAHRNNI